MNTATATDPQADSPADSPASNPADPNPQAASDTRPQSLCRPASDRMLAGVAAGIARYLDVDVTIVRIVIAVLTLAGGAGVSLYIAGWLLIPQEGSSESLASEFIQSLSARAR
jgi:phage shock protein C